MGFQWFYDYALDWLDFAMVLQSCTYLFHHMPRCDDNAMMDGSLNRSELAKQIAALKISLRKNQMKNQHSGARFLE